MPPNPLRREVLFKSLDSLDPGGIGKEKVHATVRIGQHQSSCSQNEPGTWRIWVRHSIPAIRPITGALETIPMQTAHAYAGSLNGRDIGEIVRVEESSLILIVRSNRVAFKDGQQSRHRASIVCESERALTWIDFFALRIATDWRIACSSSPVPQATSLP